MNTYPEKLEGWLVIVVGPRLGLQLPVDVDCYTAAPPAGTVASEQCVSIDSKQMICVFLLQMTFADECSGPTTTVTSCLAKLFTFIWSLHFTVFITLLPLSSS